MGTAPYYAGVNTFRAHLVVAAPLQSPTALQHFAPCPFFGTMTAWTLVGVIWGSRRRSARRSRQVQIELRWLFPPGDLAPCLRDVDAERLINDVPVFDSVPYRVAIESVERMPDMLERQGHPLTCTRPRLTPLLRDRGVGFCDTQIAPEHAKQRLGRHDLAVLQKIENRGQRARLGLRVNRLARLVLVFKFQVMILFDLGEFCLQDLESILFAHFGTTQRPYRALSPL